MATFQKYCRVSLIKFHTFILCCLIIPGPIKLGLIVNSFLRKSTIFSLFFLEIFHSFFRVSKWRGKRCWITKFWFSGSQVHETVTKQNFWDSSSTPCTRLSSFLFFESIFFIFFSRSTAFFGHGVFFRVNFVSEDRFRMFTHAGGIICFSFKFFRSKNSTMYYLIRWMNIEFFFLGFFTRIRSVCDVADNYHENLLLLGPNTIPDLDTDPQPPCLHAFSP